MVSLSPGAPRRVWAENGRGIVLHLKDKLKRYGAREVEVSQDDADVIAALTALGFSIVERSARYSSYPATRSCRIDSKIRQSLTYLGR